MANELAFTIKNGLIVPNDVDVSGNLVLSNTSSIVVGSTGPVINSSSIFGAATIVRANTIASFTVTNLSTGGFQVMSVVITTPNVPGQNFRVLLDWNLGITSSAADANRAIMCNISDGTTTFGYRTGYISGGGSVNTEGIGGFAVSPAYGPNVTKGFGLTAQVSQAIASLTSASALSYFNAFVVTSN